MKTIFYQLHSMLRGLLLLLFLLSLPVKADSVRVSILTCAPGSEIYSLFGHTAIRYQDSDNQLDWVYNYGMFSFDSPNFIYRFVKGETDYQLGVIPYKYFEAEYALRGSSVFEQTIQLTSAEKSRLKQLLDRNYLPQNRVYRYSFLADNCTTRARDILEQAIGGEIVYGELAHSTSYRQILHQFTAGHDWSELGIDLCLGEAADTVISQRQQQFAPFYLYDALKEALVVRGDSTTRLLLSDTKIVDVAPEEEEVGFPFSPSFCAYALLLLSLLLAVMQFLTGRRMVAWNLFLALLQGGAGCVITFLVLFSVHPTVHYNWLVVWLNPLSLICLPWILYASIKGHRATFYWINGACLTFFVVASPFVIQKFHPAVVPLALSLLVNAVGNLYLPIRNTKR
ncbi:MAG: DUF4105 domain-containing protein [Phocaeicola sp.]